MKTTRNSLLTLALGATVLAGTANAQAPADATAGAGTITNQTTTDTTVATTAATDGVETGEPTDAGDALPDTGGQPWLFALGGIALAGGSLMLRRKLA